MADSGKKAYFFSDLHLGATYYGETAIRRERAVAELLLSLKDSASEIYLVGDILDYWFEYKTVVPRGFIRFFGALASLSDSGVKITWLIGNHDIWLFDYLRDQIGMTVVDGALRKRILGKEFYIAHGDAVGNLDAGFRFIRSVFRNKICQKLYSAIHPRWTIPFAHAWSGHSRKSEVVETTVNPESDPFVLFAREYNLSHEKSRADYFVFGHRHIVLKYADPENSYAETIILGDWINNFTYGVFDGDSFEICIIDSKMIFR